jgi:PAS domain S-box-containing protein
MEHSKIEWWAKLLGFITAISVSIRWGWKNVIVPAWHRWKDYEARMEREAGMYRLVLRSQVATRFLLDDKAIAWYIADKDGRVIDCSDAACAILETTFQNVVDINWMQFLPSDEYERVFRKHQHAVANKESFIDTYNTYTAKGNVIRVKTHAEWTDDEFFGILTEIK